MTLARYRQCLWLLFLFWPWCAWAEGEVRIGVLAKRGSDTALARWAPTADYLTSRIAGQRFTIVPLGFDEVIPAVTGRRIEFILANSAFYVTLEAEHGASRIATLRNGDAAASHTEFGGVIFTRADNTAIQTLDDLAGKRFGAVEEASLGGFLMAWRELKDAGIDPAEDFAELQFSGTHDAVVYAVLRGLLDAGTVRTDTLERMAEEGKLRLDEVRVLHARRHADFPYLCSTRLYPEWPMAKLPHTPEALSHAVAVALLSMPADSAAARAGLVAGWTVPRNYQPVHDLLRELQVGPYADLGRITPAALLQQYGHWLLLAGLLLLGLAVANAYVATLNRRLRRTEGELVEARDHLAERVRERTAALEQTLGELAESHRRLELISRDWNDAFDAIQDPIFIHDAQMRIVHANPAYCARAGLDREQVIGRIYHEVFPVLDGPLAACRTFPEQIGESGEEIALPDGAVFVSRSFGIRRADGAVVNAIHILEDVTAERRAETRRRTLSRAVEQSGEGVLILNGERAVVYCNPALSRLAGRARGQLDGCDLISLLPEEYHDRIDTVFERVEREGGWADEIELRFLDGRHMPVYLSIGAIRGEGQDGLGYVVTVVDLSELKHAEQELTYRIRFESEVAAIASRFVASDEARLDTDIDDALRRLGQFTRADRAYLFDYAADRATITNSYEWCGAEVEAQMHRVQQAPFDAFAWLAARLRAGQVVHVPDVAALPAEAVAEKAEFVAQGIQSLVNVPITRDGTLIGFIGLDNVHERRVWVEEDVRLLRIVGDIVAAARARVAASREMRRSEASLAEAQRIARLGNWDWNIVTNRLDWSDEIYRIFGLEPQQFGATYDAFLESVHPDDREAVMAAVDKALRRESEYEIDHRVVRPDGGVRVVHEKAAITFAADGQPLRMLGTVQDVTELRAREQELQRLNRALRTLSQGNTTLVHATDEVQLLRDLCTVLVETGGYRFAWVGYAEQDAARSVRPVAHAGHEAGYLATVNISWADGGRGQGPTGRAIRTGTAHVVRDITTDPDFEPWRAAALQRGYASVIALPLRANGAVFGALTIDTAEPAAFDTEEVALLTELANDLAFGIRTLRARVEREHAEHALEESEARYHTLYEAAPNAYASVRASDGALLQFNQALCHMLGYTRDELRGMRVFDLYADAPDGQPAARQVFQRFVAGEAVRDAELQMRHKDGHPIWISLSVDPVHDAQGRVSESRSSIIDISARKRAEAERVAMAEQLQRSLFQTIQAISVTIEKRDPYTAGHQQRVAELAVAIGRELGLADDRLHGLRLGALIHDIGKIYVPTEILNRPGKLDAAQFQLIKSHPGVGYDIIRGIEFPWPLADIVAQHHERMDGTGYPAGLQGEAILLEARILSVADVVEAMASHRPYRPALTIDRALREIEEHKHDWFDPQVVDACLRLFHDQGFAWTAPLA